MLIWIAMAVLAVAALVPVLAPLTRRRAVAIAAEAPAVAIYRDQLAEIDRDLDRGTIGENEAEAARIEIARRLIKAGGEVAPKASADRRAERIAAVGIVAMPVLALAFYLGIGAPNMPGQPLASRADIAETQDVATLIAAVETHLAANPDDGEGWGVVAPVYVRVGRYDDAVTAYGNAIRILGPTAERELQLGDAIVRAAGGNVPPEARAAFERAAELAPDDPRPRFFLAMALGEEGKREEAIAAWQALIASGPEDAPWLAVAKEELAALQAPASGPTQADVAAAANMSAEDRNAMIEGMVASLATRLADSPDDAEGWARLVRSYGVLGRADDARAALEQARQVFAADQAKLETVERAAREAGVAESSP